VSTCCAVHGQNILPPVRLPPSGGRTTRQPIGTFLQPLGPHISGPPGVTTLLLSCGSHAESALARRLISWERTLGRSLFSSISWRVAVLRLKMQAPSSSSAKPLGQLVAMQRPSFSIWRRPHSKGQTRSDLALIASSSSFVGSTGEMVSRASLANFWIDARAGAVCQSSSRRPS
jgi:hypothetical protein